jgi:sirohydrochlorin ferrochelatase
MVSIHVLLIPVPAGAHPLEYHLDPLDSRMVERVLASFELLTADLEAAGRLGSARLPENAMGVTALLWSLEGAVAAMDETPAVDSPALLSALAAAGYEPSPYIVAEWKMEAERVLESYEVLSDNLQFESLYRGLSELESSRDRLSGDEAEQREAELIRQMSMLRTTAGDIAQVAPYRARLDALTGKLNP